MKRSACLPFCILLAALLWLPFKSAAQPCALTIPQPNTASAYIASEPAWWNFDYSAADNQSMLTNHMFSDTAGVPAGPYLSWCIDVPDDINGNGAKYTASLYSSCDTLLDTELPNNYPSSVYVSPTVWHEINYILNHKNGAYFYDVQIALWNLIGGPIAPVLTEGNAQGYPNVNTTEVSNLLYAAQTSAGAWEPSCGDVIAVVVAIHATTRDQLTIIEVPYPCVPCVSVTKTVACLDLNGDCGVFSHAAGGFISPGTGLSPAFCYDVMITNCGTVPLTNVTVSDSLLANLTSSFFPNPTTVLLPGQAITNHYTMSVSANTTNVVTVTGSAVLPQNSITNINGPTVTNGTIVTAVDQAMAYVAPASISCDVSLYSSNDLDGNPTDNNVLLPSSTTLSYIVFNITVNNSGSSDLTGITLTGLSAIGCTMPPPFELAAGLSTNIQLCVQTVNCPGQTFSIGVTGQIGSDSTHCAVLTSAGAPMTVSTSCGGTVEYTVGVSGTVFEHCNPLNCDFSHDSGLSGVTVILTGVTTTLTETTTTDSSGDYSFTNLPAGTYVVSVAPGAPYVQTCVSGNAGGQATVTLVPCSANGVNFAFANTTPPQVTVKPGLNYGCNPTVIISDQDEATNVTVTAVSCGSSNVVVTHIDSTNLCAAQRVFTIVVSDTYGNSVTNTVTFFWTVNGLPPTITVPPGYDLGCNPSLIPGDLDLSNTVSVTGNCSSATSFNVSHVDNNLSTCTPSRVFTITATDACGNSATQTVIITWSTATPPVLTVPGTITLGCNPQNLSTYTCAYISSLVQVHSDCSTATFKVTVAPDSIGNCSGSRLFTIIASDTCRNTATQTVLVTWTTAAPPVLTVPGTITLGCNPQNLSTYTVAYISNKVSVIDSCSTATFTVTVAPDSLGACSGSRLFTIIAKDACGNGATQTVNVTWTTAAPPVLTVPGTITLGCNPQNLSTYTVAYISNKVSLIDSCSTATFTVTVAPDSIDTCSGSRLFTIIAKDACGNGATQTVNVTWTVDSSGPSITCPPAVTIVTNSYHVYCTFAPSDWGGSCNGNNYGYGSYGNSWWGSWAQNNNNGDCASSFNNWWQNCTGNNGGGAAWWSSWNSQNTGSGWWNGWTSASSGNWWNQWNKSNWGNQSFVPCGGNNPGSILCNNYNTVYPSGCVKIGYSNGYCLTFNSYNAVRNCFGFNGSPGKLNCSAVNPTSCSAGSFCSQVLALQLNCDFGDANGGSQFFGRCGDLVLNNPSSPCNGKRVRDICNIANCALGGGPLPPGCTLNSLCSLVACINQSFQGCQVSPWCSANLCPVYNPPPSKTGWPIVSGGCSTIIATNHCDTVTQLSCAGSYLITRTWTAIDACGMSNECQQLITIQQSPSSSINGTVVVACSGDSNLGNNQGLSGVTVTLLNGTTTVGTDKTDSNGNYQFNNLMAGIYTVVVTPPYGYTQTAPSGNSNSQTITIDACQSADVPTFGYIGSTPGVLLTKTGPVCATNGQTITYTFKVCNTNNTCLSISVSDPLLGGIIFTQSGVAPGQSLTFTSNYTINAAKGACALTNTATATGTAPNGKTATSTAKAITALTTKPCMSTVCGSFGYGNPGGGYVWCNAHLSSQPKQKCNVYCQGGTITLNCNNGKTYSYPVPDCKITFDPSCTSPSTYFDGACWNTTMPCNGDDQILLSACGIPWNSDFVGCKNVCWTAKFCSDYSGFNCNWQWGAACYNADLSSCGNVNVKPCHSTYCAGYSSSDYACTPENYKSSCVNGGSGNGGNNYCGNWSSTASVSCK